MVTSLWRNRELIRAATRREVLARYRGSALGLLWSFCTPLLMLTVYTFVFGEIFKARWSPDSTSRSEFALVLFVGLIVFNVFSECINRAPTAIIANPNYVKKILFPLEILPFVSLCSAMYHAMVSVGVWLLVYGLLFGAPHVTVLYLPLILGPLCLFILGLSWALASLGVFFTRCVAVHRIIHDGCHVPESGVLSEQRSTCGLAACTATESPDARHRAGPRGAVLGSQP